MEPEKHPTPLHAGHLYIDLAFGYRPFLRVSKTTAGQTGISRPKHPHPATSRTTEIPRHRQIPLLCQRLPRTAHPLTLLLGPIHTLLKDGQLTDKQVRLLQMAGQSGKQLEQLVNDILDLRKLEQGHLVLHPKPTGLSAFVRTYCPI
ncbi:MAG: hypothetical protein IPM98_15520 [Lewinellaceae bacterium]|nr:hypothetical protein [Lewinellaceae bacterium]